MGIAAILSTNDIERSTFTVPFDVDDGGEWIWIAHRTPWLRDALARIVLVVVLTVMVFRGLARDAVRAWRAVQHSITDIARS